MKLVEGFMAMLIGVLLGGIVVPLMLNWLLGR